MKSPADSMSRLEGWKARAFSPGTGRAEAGVTGAADTEAVPSGNARAQDQGPGRDGVADFAAADRGAVFGLDELVLGLGPGRGLGGLCSRGLGGGLRHDELLVGNRIGRAAGTSPRGIRESWRREARNTTP